MALGNYERVKIWRKENPDKVKEYNRTSVARFNNSKSKANERQLDFTLTFEEFTALICNPCYYCGNLLGKATETTAGLDRLDNNLGYIHGNCVSCCNRCNKIKMNDLTPEETKAAVHAILTIRKGSQNG